MNRMKSVRRSSYRCPFCRSRRKPESCLIDSPGSSLLKVLLIVFVAVPTFTLALYTILAPLGWLSQAQSFDDAFGPAMIVFLGVLLALVGVGEIAVIRHWCRSWGDFCPDCDQRIS